MIYAKTGMEQMPESCQGCEIYFALGKHGHCVMIDSIVDGFVEDALIRLPNCPLVSIDETLPAQLECAEMRLKKLDRLLEFEGGDTGDERN